MTDAPTKPVLLTGASGALGRMLTKSLSALGWTLRLTDIAPFPDPVPAGAAFTECTDLATGRRWYANPTTGETVWTLPPGAVITARMSR